MYVNIPRVLALLDEIISEIKSLQENVAESNAELVGVFDRLAMHIESQRNELLKEKLSYEKLSKLMRFIADLIYIIDKWTDTLYYKFNRFLAILNKVIRGKMSVGKNIKLFRINANLKQKDLAAKLGIKDSYLSLIENEKKEPSLSLLKKISKALDVPIAMFFWENMEEDEATTPIGRLKRLLFELDAEMKRPYAKPKTS